MRADIFLPKIVFSSNSLPEIKIPNDYNAIELYKKKLQLMQVSSVLTIGRHGLTMAKDREVLCNKLFDKLYLNEKTNSEILTHNFLDENSLVTILNLLKSQQSLIVNIDRIGLSLPDDYQNMIILDANRLLSKEGIYDLSFNTWKGSASKGTGIMTYIKRLLFHLLMNLPKFLSKPIIVDIHNHSQDNPLHIWQTVF